MPKRNVWTEREIRTLRKMAEDGYGAGAISERLGRKRSSVLAKASSLKVKIGRVSETGILENVRKAHGTRDRRDFVQ